MERTLVPSPHSGVPPPLLKRPTSLHDVARHLKLPPPPDADLPNDTGLPRRLVVNMILPTEQPSLTSAKADGECVQLIFVFVQSAAKLRAWQQSGAPAAKLFTRWCADADAARRQWSTPSS